MEKPCNEKDNITVLFQNVPMHQQNKEQRANSQLYCSCVDEEGSSNVFLIN